MVQAVAGKLKKTKTDITAEKIVTDQPLEFGRMQDEEEEEEAAARLPGEEVWQREALISTKSEAPPYNHHNLLPHNRNYYIEGF